MVAATRKQPKKAAKTEIPTDSDEAGFIHVTAADPMSPLITKLSELREKYLSELQDARDKVKKNFLK